MTTNNINPLSLPYVFLSEKSKLPETSGVYFVITPSNRIIYIGSSSNLRKRWCGHNRLKDFDDYRYVKITWLEVKGQGWEILESYLINKFCPILNKHGMPWSVNKYIDERLSLHLDRNFISELIEGVIDDDPFDIAIAMDIGLL